jgi:hypothetical protein
MTTTIPPELRRAIEESGGGPVRLEDPETREEYVLVSVQTYQKMLDDLDEPDRRAIARVGLRNAVGRMDDEP